MSRPTRRVVLGGIAAAAVPTSAYMLGPSAYARPRLTPGTRVDLTAWQLRWSPEASQGGLGAFETLEDDRADSHTAARPHIFATGNNFRFNMHMVDRDTSTDRQRHEVTGCRQPSGGSHLIWRSGQTWRVTYSMFIPSSLKATTTFTHIMQTKQPGPGGAPITVTSLRRVSGVQTIEHKVFEPNILVGRTDLVPLHDKWIDIEYEHKIGDGSSGAIRWVVRSGGSTVVDASRTGVDTFLADRVRPKWGIYRSLGDSSGSLQDCYLLLTNMRGYQLVSSSGTEYQAEQATISQGVVESNHAGFTGSGFVNLDNLTGSYVEWAVPATAAGNVSMAVRFANGTTVNRPMAVSVNGTVVASNQSFNPTGAWTTWQENSLTVPLRSGTNTIRLTSTTSNGGPNLDKITIA